jgi:hypothetical protein
MRSINKIYEAIDADGFKESTLQLIDEYVNDIENGRTNFSRFNEQEHAGLCKAGAPLIGASVIACYARRSLTTGRNAEGCQGVGPFNWEIDEKQEKLIELWAKATGFWFVNSDRILQKNLGPMIAQGAEAIVYYSEGAPTVTKERASIYSTTEKALDAIVLHNYLFPETAMNVFGFTRDSDGLFRIVLTQPYVRCMRLATKEEIDEMVAGKGFRDNWNCEGVNYISDRLALEDMHPANVFIDEVTGRPICIDCIVKFVNNGAIETGE